MKLKILCSNIETKGYYEAIVKTCETLKVEVVNIDSSQINKKIGYLLGEDNYSDEDISEFEDDGKPMMLFAGFTRQKLDIILELFKREKVPSLKLKAMLTQTNIEWSFAALKKEINEEADYMRKNKESTHE